MLGGTAWLYCLRRSARLNASAHVSILLQPGSAGTLRNPTAKCHSLPEAPVELLCLHLRLCAGGASGGPAAAAAPTPVGVPRDAGGLCAWAACPCAAQCPSLNRPCLLCYRHGNCKMEGPCCIHRSDAKALPYSNFPKELPISSYRFLCIRHFLSLKVCFCFFFFNEKGSKCRCSIIMLINRKLV